MKIYFEEMDEDAISLRRKTDKLCRDIREALSTCLDDDKWYCQLWNFGKRISVEVCAFTYNGSKPTEESVARARTAVAKALKIENKWVRRFDENVGVFSWEAYLTQAFTFDDGTPVSLSIKLEGVPGKCKIKAVEQTVTRFVSDCSEEENG